MNIFEALEKGNGKATVLGNLNLSYVYYDNGRFLARLPVWTLPQEVPYSALQRNDWIPYVPRGTCSNCGVPSIPGSIRMVKLTPDYKCVECGRGDIFEVVPPSLKVKHKEVFENVRWDWWTDSSIYPNIDIDKRHSFLDKPPMKMTLEWEK